MAEDITCWAKESSEAPFELLSLGAFPLLTISRVNGEGGGRRRKRRRRKIEEERYG